MSPIIVCTQMGPIMGPTNLGPKNVSQNAEVEETGAHPAQNGLELFSPRWSQTI